MLVSMRADSKLHNLESSVEHMVMLALRLVTLTILVALLTMHMRSLRVFRWEQSVSGGLLVTYTVAVVGLALCAGIDHCGAKAIQTYLSGVGAVLLGVNGAMVLRRWRSNDMARMVAELLGALGVPLRRQILVKAALSGAAAVMLILDLALTLIWSQQPQVMSRDN